MFNSEVNVFNREHLYCLNTSKYQSFLNEGPMTDFDQLSLTSTLSS